MDHSMSRKEWVMFKTDAKRFKSLSNNRYYCYCGHSVVINPPETRTLCTHCGHWVYKDKKLYFKERLRGYIDGNKSSIK